MHRQLIPGLRTRLSKCTGAKVRDRGGDNEVATRSSVWRLSHWGQSSAHKINKEQRKDLWAAGFERIYEFTSRTFVCLSLPAVFVLAYFSTFYFLLYFFDSKSKRLLPRGDLQPRIAVSALYIAMLSANKWNEMKWKSSKEPYFQNGLPDGATCLCGKPSKLTGRFYRSRIESYGCISRLIGNLIHVLDWVTHPCRYVTTLCQCQRTLFVLYNASTSIFPKPRIQSWCSKVSK